MVIARTPLRGSTSIFFEGALHFIHGRAHAVAINHQVEEAMERDGCKLMRNLKGVERVEREADGELDHAWLVHRGERMHA